MSYISLTGPVPDLAISSYGRYINPESWIVDGLHGVTEMHLSSVRYQMQLAADWHYITNALTNLGAYPDFWTYCPDLYPLLTAHSKQQKQIIAWEQVVSGYVSDTNNTVMLRAAADVVIATAGIETIGDGYTNDDVLLGKHCAPSVEAQIRLAKILIEVTH